MAKLAPQPNIVRYHTAWIETVDQTERLEQNNNTIDDSDSDDSQELLIKGEEEELFDSCPGFIFETSKTAATVVSSPGRPSPSTLSDMSRNNVASTVTLTDASKPSASAESTILYIQVGYFYIFNEPKIHCHNNSNHATILFVPLIDGIMC